MAYYPLWSGILIQNLDVRRLSNADVESWNNIMKNFVFDHEMRNYIYRGIRILAENIRRRLLTRKYSTLSSRQLANQRKRKHDKVSKNDDYSDPDYKNTAKVSKKASFGKKSDITKRETPNAESYNKIPRKRNHDKVSNDNDYSDLDDNYINAAKVSKKSSFGKKADITKEETPNADSL